MSNNAAMKHRLVSTAAVAEEIHLGTSTIRQYAREGRIPIAETTPGGHHRYDLDAVKEELGKMRARTIEKPAFRMSLTSSRRKLPIFALTPGEVKVAPGQLGRRQAFERRIDRGDDVAPTRSYFSVPGSARVGSRYRERVAS